jgi:hypothetical protein
LKYALTILCLLVPCLGCGTPGRNVVVELDSAPKPLEASLVAHEVGRLLSADPDVSSHAEGRLTSLNEDGRQQLAAHAARIPDERDPRWLFVLDENHALMPLPPEEELDYLLWKVTRPETFYATKAQARLLDLARAEPELMLRRLDRGGQGVEAVALALAMAGETRVVPPLLARYRHARTPHERRVAAEALGAIAGEENRPRPSGLEPEIQRDADAVERWYRSLGDGVGDRDARAHIR